MKKISKLFNTLPKRFAAYAALIMAFAFPVTALASDAAVAITATTYVANYTAGDTTWKNSVDATYDQVVKIDVTYDNTEAAGSGKTADNLNVKINIPSTPGATQTINTVTKATNSNEVDGHATVNLGRSDAYLQYIPGSAVWEHAVSANSSQTTEAKVSDAVVSSNGLVLENENPCQAGSVVIEARVMVPGFSVTKQVEKADQTGAWATQNTANPGDTLKYMITYKNTGNTTEKNVLVKDNLPPHMTLVPNTTYLTNSNNANGALYKSDDVVNGGIYIGDYAPGATAYVVFQVKIDDASKLACGNTEFRNVGAAMPEGITFHQNTAITNVMNGTCSTPTTPTTPSTPSAPTQLPNTGPGSVIAIFAGASALGAVAYRLFLARRLARES